MPTFYIDASDGDRLTKDAEGATFVDIAEARRAAISLLPDMARDVLPDGDRRDFTAVLRGQNGKPILKAKLALSVTWLIEEPIDANFSSALRTSPAFVDER